MKDRTRKIILAIKFLHEIESPKTVKEHSVKIFLSYINTEIL